MSDASENINQSVFKTEYRPGKRQRTTARALRKGEEKRRGEKERGEGNRQLGSAHSIQAALSIDMVVAWRIFHLAKLGREVPDAPCTIFFEESEWKALMCFVNKAPIPPQEPPSLKEALIKVAILGGFLGRKRDGMPGTQTLWRGLERLSDITSVCSIAFDST